MRRVAPTLFAALALLIGACVPSPQDDRKLAWRLGTQRTLAGDGLEISASSAFGNAAVRAVDPHDRIGDTAATKLSAAAVRITIPAGGDGAAVTKRLGAREPVETRRPGSCDAVYFPVRTARLLSLYDVHREERRLRRHALHGEVFAAPGGSPSCPGSLDGRRVDHDAPCHELTVEVPAAETLEVLGRRLDRSGGRPAA